MINFRTDPEQREWFKRAAHAECLTLSAWLRRLATLRAAEVLSAGPGNRKEDA